MADKKAWGNFAEQMKEKRKNTKRKDDVKVSAGGHILAEKELIVQRLASAATGKSMKYERLGPQEFVHYQHDEVSLQNIKKSCHEHFKQRLPVDDMECDILASQNGPSCTKLTHIKNFKLIFVRFIPPKLSATSARSEYGNYSYSVIDTLRTAKQRPQSTSDIQSPNKSTSSLLLPPPSRTQKTHTLRKFPMSISISSMLKLGSAISSTVDLPKAVQFLEFDVSSLQWSHKKEKKLSIEKEPFAHGGFRSVFHAKSEKGEQFVVKKFLPSTLETLKDVNMAISKLETIETLAKKSVQIHMLAKNFAELLQKRISDAGVCEEFGKTFTYCKAYLGILEENNSSSYLMIEEFIEGEFQKYLNNDGFATYNESVDMDLVQKAECLSHFSFMKSQSNILLVDIQGANYVLFDPEIATAKDAIDEYGGLKFCMGNLAKVACDNFIAMHECTKFCKLIDLKPLS